MSGKGEDNPGFGTESIPMKESGKHVLPISDDHVVVEVDDKTHDRNHYNNGVHLNGVVPDSYDERNDLVLQRKEFDSSNANACSRGIMAAQTGLVNFVKENKEAIKIVIGVLLLSAYLAYFCYAMYYRFGDEGSIRLLVCTAFGILLLVLHFQRHRFEPLSRKLATFFNDDRYAKVRRIIRWYVNKGAVVDSVF